MFVFLENLFSLQLLSPMLSRISTPCRTIYAVSNAILNNTVKQEAYCKSILHSIGGCFESLLAHGRIVNIENGSGSAYRQSEHDSIIIGHF